MEKEKEWDEIIERRLAEVKALREKLAKVREDINALKIYDSTVPLDIPYVPSTSEKVDIMASLAGNLKGKKTADLGSGDGRVVIKFAENGALAHGFELEPNRVETSRKKIQERNLQNSALIFQQNFFEVNLADYDIITIYGLDSIMDRAREKLEKECKSGLMVISNRFTIPGWQAIGGKQDVFFVHKELAKYLYQKC